MKFNHIWVFILLSGFVSFDDLKHFDKIFRWNYRFIFLKKYQYTFQYNLDNDSKPTCIGTLVPAIITSIVSSFNHLDQIQDDLLMNKTGWLIEKW